MDNCPRQQKKRTNVRSFLGGLIRACYTVPAGVRLWRMKKPAGAGGWDAMMTDKERRSTIRKALACAYISFALSLASVALALHAAFEGG